MTDEAEPKDEFMHRPGELFIASGEIHVLAQVGTGFTPADTECEEYEAVCGTESQSWSMPAQNIPGAEFIASLKDGEEKGAKECLGCFQSPEEIKSPDVYIEPFRDEKEIAGNIPPEISEYGRKVLQIVADCKNRATYHYPGNVYSWLDPIIPDFGDLNDKDTPCRLAVNDYYTPETSTDGDYSEVCREILLFDKKMAIEALSKVQPGKTVTGKGSGRAVHFLDRSGWGYNRNENTIESDINNDVEVVLNINLTPEADGVTFEFSSKSLNPDNTFAISRKINL